MLAVENFIHMGGVPKYSVSSLDFDDDFVLRNAMNIACTVDFKSAFCNIGQKISRLMTDALH